jgi:hypothetical protein
MIIGFEGRKQSGKDTSADFLVNSSGFTKKSFADPLKEACILLFGCTREQVYGTDEDKNSRSIVKWDDIRDVYYPQPRYEDYLSCRELLQIVGTDIFRSKYDKIWINSAFTTLKDDHDYVFADVRFDNEAKSIIERGGFVIRVTKEGENRLPEHSSEMPISQEYINATILNEGTLDELRGKVIEQIESFRSVDRNASNL